MKWIVVIVLVIVGALAAFVAVEYLTVAIHGLPSYIPGHKTASPHHAYRGHYHKRGAVAAVIAVVAFGAAGYLAYRFRRTGQPTTAAAPAAGSADSLVSNSPSDGGEPVNG